MRAAFITHAFDLRASLLFTDAAAFAMLRRGQAPDMLPACIFVANGRGIFHSRLIRAASTQRPTH